MGFLRRIFGGGQRVDSAAEEADRDVADESAGPVEPDADERSHELEILRAEAERLDDLTQRQLRYADHAWQPPAQGGERRADDGDKAG